CLSFLSFAYVLPRGLTLAVYRHELGNFATAFQTQGPYDDDFPGSCPGAGFPNGICRFRVRPRQAKTDLKITNYGLSGAFAFDLPPFKGVQSNLSIGAGVSRYELQLFGSNRAYALDRLTALESRLPGGFYGPPDYSQDNLVIDTEERGDDNALGLNLG